MINEICPSNVSNKLNENGEYDDWIEIYNAGNAPVNMGGYGLSDEIGDPFKFIFPYFELGPQQKVLVFASDQDRTDISNHWETAVNAQTSWKYAEGTSQPDTNWRNLSFNDAGWSSGSGGIGFGDGDDNTTISNCASVMMRKEFFVPDTGNIASAVFNIDYDDAFVAYLNGCEIARANIGVPGDRPSYNDYANSPHEAMMYQGHDPDSFYIDANMINALLRPGVNVLAVQVHNYQPNSGDLSAIPYLSFGMLSSTQTFSNTPSWFNAPGFQYFQANFKLSREGETILLTDKFGVNLDQQILSRMEPNHSTGRSPDGDATWCVFTTATPLGSNGSSTCYPGYASDPVFSKSEGFYSSSQSLSLSTSMGSAKIRYTTDGSEPTSNSTQFNNSLSLNSTKTIRVKVFRSGYLPSPTFTKSYFINENIDLPVVTISTDPDNLWDFNDGIYATGPNASAVYPYKGANYWEDWEKPAAIEYYDKNKNRQFAFNANIEIFGNYSQAKPQKSFEIKLSDEMGTSSVEYSIFSDKPQITEFDNFVLRNAGTDWNEVHYRDALMERVMKTTHSGYLAAEPAVVFLNGEYWGVYTIHENHDQHWTKSNFGVGKDEIDMLLEGGNIETKFGSDDGFWDLLNYALNENPSAQQFYDDIDEMLDIQNFVDYMIAETYYGNGDWMGDWTNNIKIWRSQETGGKWRYLLYDLDMGLGYSSSVNTNTLGIARNPLSTNNTSDLFDALLQNPTFKTYFINRYADLINTIYKPSLMKAVSRQFEDSMRSDMYPHFDRWPTFNGDYFSMGTWNSEINQLEDFIDDRPTIARNFIRSEFGLQSNVTLTLNTSPAGSGRIQISTVNPTSYPWSGVYFRGNPVTITAMPNPGYTFDHWRSNVAISSNNPDQELTVNFNSSDQITAYFNGSSESPKITISEINYNSAGTINAGDWVELHNHGNVALDISNWKIRDEQSYHTFTFPVQTVIEAGEYLVLAEDMSKFSSMFPHVNNVIGPLGFNFSNSGDDIRLFDHQEADILNVNYNDNSPWPTDADGEGYTLELIDPLGNLSSGNNWFAGCVGGTPGRAYSAPSATVNTSGSTTFCDGDNVDLQATQASGNSYQWYLNGYTIFGATNDTYSAYQAGTYTVRVSYQGCSVISGGTDITVNPQTPSPIVQDTSHCGPGTFTLQAIASDSVFWYDAPHGGQLIAQGTVFSTPVLQNTTQYFVVAGLDCPSNPVSVTAIIRQAPNVFLGADTAIQSGGMLTLDAGGPFDTYDWSTGETSQTISVNAAGNYSVIVTDMYSCVGSDDIDVSIISIVDSNVHSEHPLQAYPLPARDMVVLEFVTTNTSGSELRLFNTEGRLIRTVPIHASPGVQRMEMDLRELPSGLYFLSLTDSHKDLVIKLPVE
ncbi:MAG: CotH kinase family protein [Bacteroidia bacterium]|nr:CotH kinase family protein [Bacteroidia bacterium]